MHSTQLYQNLDHDFIKPGMSDDWLSGMQEISAYLSDNFKQRQMGLVCDFTDTINHVFTAVFPSDKVMQTILDKNINQALIFLHHPMIWDIRKAPQIFSNIKTKYLDELKARQIAIYALHVPLDDFGSYSTSSTLADSLQISKKTAFGEYFGGMAGVIGEASVSSVSELRKIFATAVGHEVNLYDYGTDEIKDKKVAVVAGGGLRESIQEVADKGINVLVTGISSRNSHSQASHDIAKQHGVSILGGTHYSTEKFACQKMCEYFKNQGLSTEFIADDPLMEDM